MAEEKVYLRVFRFDPSRDRSPVYREYEVPWRENLLLLVALKYIRETEDETLAFRDYCCGCSWCFSCLMMVNGKATLACSRILEPGEVITVEPMRGFPIVRDLVCDFGIDLLTPQGLIRRKEGTLLRKLRGRQVR
jgi:succinate dehydrogenase/fumarate reductase-like Fe-S protein